MNSSFRIGFSRILFSTIALVGLSACSKPISTELTQVDLKSIGQNLQITYQVVDNRAGEHCDASQSSGACFISEITFSSDTPLPANGWSIFFSQVSPAQKILAGNFSIEHVNGDLHKLTPKPEFSGIEANSPQTIRFSSNFWHLSESDIMPNYFVAPSHNGLALDAVTIDSTRITIDPDTGLEVQNYTGVFTNTEQHLLRSPKDLTPISTPESTYRSNQDIELNLLHAPLAVIPSPKSITSTSNEQLNLSKGLTLALKNIDHSAIDAAMIALAGMGFNETAQGVPLTIQLNRQVESTLGTYSLLITHDGIDIRANDEEGAANALRSLASLIIPGSTNVPLLIIEDSPRYEFRGLHIDVARNFHSKQLILNVLEQMATFKLNKFHLHLGDDEGWRLQIDGLPELTDIGSKRCYDPLENNCLLPQLGSGPDVNNAVNGFYSNKDYIEILRYADARHIQVIPSFDMPGHSRAAVKSMEARYRKFMAKEDPTGAEEYLLSDINDTSEYLSVQFYTDNTLNVCMDSTYHFLDKVISEVQELHVQAGQPLTRYHIGADETAGAWSDSPRCQAFFADAKNQVKSAEELSGYFVERVANMLATRGIQAAGWSDGMGHTRTGHMPDIVQSNGWGPLFWDGHKAAHNQANRMWELVVSTPDFTYFDAPYETDPKEPGYYWTSRGTNTREVFNFMPDNLPAHAEWLKGRQGEDLLMDDSQEPLKPGVTFSGLQGHIWSETIRTDERVEFMLFPRIVALAERAWSTANWELPYDYSGKVYSAETRFFTANLKQSRDQDWEKFASHMAAKVLPKLDLAGIHYRIPTPGATVIKGQLMANVSFPGLPIDYRVDGDKWQSWRAPVHLGEYSHIEVRARSADGKRKGRAWSLKGL